MDKESTLFLNDDRDDDHLTVFRVVSNYFPRPAPRDAPPVPPAPDDGSGGALGAAPPTARTVVSTGSSANRIDMVFLGDGYTADQLTTTYTSHVRSYLEYIFDDSALTQPFGRYDRFFNIHVVDVVSNQNGADNPVAGITRDTALDASYYFDGVTQRLLSVNNAKANSAVSSAFSGTGVTAEMRYVVVNDTLYGGAGGAYGVFAGGNASAREIALHEIAHSFAGLADEYGGFTSTYSGTEPREVNVTKDPTGAKWAEWIGYIDPNLGTVGAYEGARYYEAGLFRPTYDSKMRSLGRAFDPIAREELVHAFYRFVDPLDGYTANTATLRNTESLSVDAIDPDVIHIDWIVNGQTFVNAGETFEFAAHGLGTGSYSVTARAYDPTDWVRGDRTDLEQSVTWNVVNKPDLLSGRTDFDANGKTDLVWKSTSGAVQLWTMDGTTNIANKVFGPYSGWGVYDDLSDFNGDGKTDLVWKSTSGAVQLWTMDGTTNIANKVFGPYAGWDLASSRSDFNGDGTNDLLWQHSNGSVNLWLMDGTSNTANRVYGPYGGWTVSDASSDFNGDGKDDLTWQHADGSISIWLMDGTTNTANAAFGRYAGWSLADTHADYNGDGKNDLTWEHTNGAVAIWLMDGTTNTANAAFGPYSGWSLFDNLADYNGDGKSDITWKHTSGAVSLWLMDGATNTANQAYGAYAGWDLTETRNDFNADGKSDLIWKGSTGAISTWLMDGTANIANAVHGPYAGWQQLKLEDVFTGPADFNGDGKSDIAWQSANGALAVWTMDGTTNTANAAFGPYAGWTPDLV